MKIGALFLLLLPANLAAQDSMYVSHLDVLEPYETRMTAHGIDYKSFRVMMILHAPFVQTWRRKDGRSLTAADAALLANRLPVCPERTKSKAVDGQRAVRQIIGPAPITLAGVAVEVKADAVVISYACDMGGRVVHSRPPPPNVD